MAKAISTVIKYAQENEDKISTYTSILFLLMLLSPLPGHPVDGDARWEAEVPVGEYLRLGAVQVGAPDQAARSVGPVHLESRREWGTRRIWARLRIAANMMRVKWINGILLIYKHFDIMIANDTGSIFWQYVLHISKLLKLYLIQLNSSSFNPIQFKLYKGLVNFYVIKIFVISDWHPIPIFPNPKLPLHPLATDLSLEAVDVDACGRLEGLDEDGVGLVRLARVERHLHDGHAVREQQRVAVVGGKNWNGEGRKS